MWTSVLFPVIFDAGDTVSGSVDVFFYSPDINGLVALLRGLIKPDRFVVSNKNKIIKEQWLSSLETT